MTLGCLFGHFRITNVSLRLSVLIDAFWIVLSPHISDRLDRRANQLLYAKT